MNISDKKNRKIGLINSNEDCFKFYNDILDGHYFNKKIKDSTERNKVFLVATPRSGSTIVSQLLSSIYKVCYIDGYSAKFWKSTELGCEVSKSFSKNILTNGKSKFGSTALDDIHSFHYFWMYHLKLKDASDLFKKDKNETINWEKLNKEIDNIIQAYNLPLFMKGYYPGYFATEISRNIQNTFWIHLKRKDVLKQALSIYHARKAICQDINSWWSMIPPNYQQVEDLNVYQQIKHQIFSLNAYFTDQLNQIRRENTYEIFYEDLIEDPQKTIHKLSEWLNIEKRDDEQWREVLHILKPIKDLKHYNTCIVNSFKETFNYHELQ